jgi:NitT/TauT family transport system permease protein
VGGGRAGRRRAGRAPAGALGDLGEDRGDPTHPLADFQQTFLKAVLAGYAIGCLAGFVVAILIDRSPFLQKRGLLPLGNFVSALPVIGVAPIMVMWFGFDWQSKVAVVVIMTFFPMLVNTVAGLAATSHMERDLMRTYAAGWFQTLVKLRLPAAWPFIFNALKINSTLALIGAIVAEFFGTPIVGMGFRISTEVGPHECRHGLGRNRGRRGGWLRLLRDRSR